jgi:hypothetical protein
MKSKSIIHRKKIHISYKSKNRTCLHGVVCTFMIWSIYIWLIAITLTACRPIKPFDQILQSTTPISTANIESSISFSITPTPYQSIIQPKTTILIETNLYTHPKGYFSFKSPQHWIVEEDNNQVIFTAPQGEPKLKMTVLNTGYILDSTSFSAFFEIQEKKKAEELDNYIEIEQQKNLSEPSALFITGFRANKNYYRTATFYMCDQFAVVIAELQVNERDFESYKTFFDTFVTSINIDAEKISTLSVYSFENGLRHSNGQFSILVPDYWSSQRNVAEYTLVETFTSPDQNAIIQTVVYDDGKQMSKTIAGEFALALLRNNYTKQITITNDIVLKDGREVLPWRSEIDGYQGVTSFAVHGTSLLSLTIIWNNDPDQIYEKLLEQVFLSYELVNSD